MNVFCRIAETMPKEMPINAANAIESVARKIRVG